MKQITSILKVFSFLTFCISLKSFAVLAPGSVSTATGGAGRSTLEPIDSVLLNPSIVSLLPSKFFSANYSKHQWGLTISDNGKEALFPAALAFARSEQDSFKTQQLGLALSYGYQKILSVGATFSMMEYEDTTNYLDKKYRQTVADIGLLYQPSQQIGFGLVFNKAASTKTDLDESLQVQQTVSIGSQFTYLGFARFRFDVESAPAYKTNKLVYMGGIETYLNDWIVARVGYQNNNITNKNYSSGGLGFSGPQFGLHYAYISDVDRTDEKHLIDLGIPF